MTHSPFSLGLSAFLLGIQSSVINLNLILYADLQLGMSAQEIAVFCTFFQISAFISNIIIPYLGDQFNKKILFIASVLTMSASLLVLATITTYKLALLTAIILLGQQRPQ